MPNSRTVFVIDTATNTVSATVPMEVQSSGIAVHPAGTRVYVTNSSDDTVSVINTATNTVENTIPVGDNPLYVGMIIGPSAPAALTLTLTLTGCTTCHAGNPRGGQSRGGDARWNDHESLALPR